MSRPTIAPGAVLLHYRLVERLGAGGMGVVWKAVDATLDREVAIKILPEAFAANPAHISRFEREARLLASLSHPNVAAVYGLHETGGLHFLTMELVRGRTLTEEIAAGLSPSRVVELATAIADGLAAAHRQRVVHRDLKPDNIMIDGDGRPKILDFGLAKLSPLAPPPDAATAVRASGDSVQEENLTREGSLLGTVAYMSPEQAQGNPVDARSDVFSFGIVLYEMVTGRRPFTGSNTISILSSILRDTPPSMLQSAPSQPIASLDPVVRRCLQKNPEDRYPDASAIRQDLLAPAAPPPLSSGARPRRWVTTAIAIVVVAALATGAAWMWRRHERQTWVRQDALPRLAAITGSIQALFEGRESWDAYVLARQIEAAAPDEPLLGQLREKYARRVSITSDPPGAQVSLRYYDEPDAEPIVLGRTPLEDVELPRGFTRIRLDLPGRVAVEDVIPSSVFAGDEWAYRLHTKDEIPHGMVYVPEGSFGMFIPGLDHLPREPMAAFFIDRHEVSNADFKRFVDAGGYSDPRYWREPFTDGAQTLTHQEAMARFVDRTGRPGPASWELGAPPPGKDAFPVAGVSWYEAAAYAVWAKKSLPSVFHWNRIALTPASARIIPMSNFSGQGLVATGSTRAMSRFGVCDLAGNVREWISNADEDHLRYILGGGWNDPDWAFSSPYGQRPFDRSATNGFRCIRVDGKEINTALHRTLETEFRDYRTEKPVDDAVFAQYLRQFTYDKRPLDAKVEEELVTPAGRRQRITFAAAYGGERMMAYLFLPNGPPPYQVVVVFPGSGSIDVRSSATLDPGRVDFVQKTGRAVLFPIYKGTYERGGELKSDYPAPTNFFRDYVIMWAKDLARSIDYVETRPDLDATRIAYYGLSWGGAMGAILPAVEPRIRANVLYVAGLNFQRAFPEVDQINYVSRVRQPTLLLNGEHDFFFPTETSQKPMFDLLGTPPAHKKRLVYPDGHSVPRTEMIKESLAWLDRYLGPVGGPGTRSSS
jgi:formylglycine-generating enzyme required for sulfatase activity